MLLSIGNVRSTTRLNFSWTGSWANAADAAPHARETKTHIRAFIMIDLHAVAVAKASAEVRLGDTHGVAVKAGWMTAGAAANAATNRPSMLLRSILVPPYCPPGFRMHHFIRHGYADSAPPGDGGRLPSINRSSYLRAGDPGD